MADYNYWRTALEKPELLKDKQLKITSDPCLGFYRDRFGAPIAIFYDEEGVLVILKDGEDILRDRYADVWLSAAQRPVTEDWFRAYEETGQWPDVDEGLAGMGDNIRAGMDEPEQIELLNDEVRKYGQISDDETAARAQSLRARLLELGGIVDKKREAMKAPHLKAAREIDDAWMPPVKMARKAADTLKALVEGWETLKRRRIREAAEAAERARLEAEAANAPPPEPAPAPVPEPKSQVRPGAGRAAAVREKLMVVGIEDLKLAFESVGLRPSVHQAMRKEAQAAIDAGAESVPGFTTELQAFIR